MAADFELDLEKANELVAVWLADRPALAEVVGVWRRDPDGYRLVWQIRAGVDEEGLVWIAVGTPAGEWLGVWHGPRELVELRPRGRVA